MTRTLASLTIAALTATAAAHEGHGDDPAEDMVAAAKLFLSSLDKAGKAKATFKLDDDHREGWYFIPDKFIKPDGTRKGALIRDMTPQQRLLAHGLLASVTSSDGYREATTIMTLESILHELEGKNPIRDPELYYVSIFGEPSAKGTWGWRFEGHHLSINVAVKDGKMFSVTPSFFGTNPAIVKEGPMKGLEVLADEQNLARKIVKSLNDEQRKMAVIDVKAPADIITKQERVADRKTFLPVKGIPYEKLNVAQQKLLQALVATYAAKYRPAILEEIDGRKPIDGDLKLHFAWAGGTEPGEGHYYRIQSDKFLFEYDNTQNGANHIHAVWRDFDGDFGRDLLKEHHEKAHR